MLLYERFRTFTVSFLYEHSLDRFVGWFSFCFLNFRVFKLFVVSFSSILLKKA